MLALRYTIVFQVSQEEGTIGLDLSQHGESAYELQAESLGEQVTTNRPARNLAQEDRP